MFEREQIQPFPRLQTRTRQEKKPLLHVKLDDQKVRSRTLRWTNQTQLHARLANLFTKQGSGESHAAQPEVNGHRKKVHSVLQLFSRRL